MMKLKNPRVTKYLIKYSTLYLISFTILGLSLYLETHTTPFRREFVINDLSISHSFATVEQFDRFSLMKYSAIYPVSIMMIILWLLYIKESIMGDGGGLNKTRIDLDNELNSVPLIYKYLHVSNITVLSFSYAMGMTCFITEYLKLNISRHRPDFLDRCGLFNGLAENLKLEENIFYSYTICYDTENGGAPYGIDILNDGFKSCPSGHSSIAYCGLGFLVFWLLTMYNYPIILNNNGGILSPNRSTIREFSYGFNYKILINVLIISIVLLPMKISISRTQDYRHHYSDILSGTFIGTSICLAIFCIFWNVPLLNSKTNNRGWCKSITDCVYLSGIPLGNGISFGTEV